MAFQQGFESGVLPVSGPIYTDTIQLINATATGQYFGVINSASSYSSADYTGSVGLAFQSISDIDEPPVFSTLTSELQVPARGPVFGFYFPPPGSNEPAEFDLGNLDGSKINPATFQYVGLVEPSYWVR